MTVYASFQLFVAGLVVLIIGINLLRRDTYARQYEQGQEIKIFLQFPDFFSSSGAKRQRAVQKEGHIASEPAGQFHQFGRCQVQFQVLVEAYEGSRCVTAGRAEPRAGRYVLVQDNADIRQLTEKLL